MEMKKLDNIGYLLFGRGYLYLNVLLDVVDYCKESLLGGKGRAPQLDENNEEWQEFIKWRNRYDSNVGPLDS